MSSEIQNTAAQTASINVTAKLANLGDVISSIESGISAGLDPISLTADATKAQQTLDDLKAKLTAVKDDAEKKPLQLKIDADQARLDAAKGQLTSLQAQATESAIKPISVDTSQADRQLAELQARVEQAIGAVAHGFGEIHGEAATGADVEQTIAKLREDLVSAIKAGDTAQQAILRRGGLQFLRTFGPTGGITAAERKEILDVIGPLASIGQAQFAVKFRWSSLGGDPEVQGALAEFREKQEETNRLLREQNQLVHTSNNIATGELEATRSIAPAISSARLAAAQVQQASTVRTITTGAR